MTVILREYDHLWSSQFEMEREVIAAALGHEAKRIEHVGSTSIPGMMAKPIIDIAVGIDSFADFNADFISKLEEIGYEYVPKLEFPNRRFFRRGQWGAGTHHLHVYELTSDDWKKIICFRDYLRNHPEVAMEYMNLKQLLVEGGIGREAYTNRKGPFIQSVVKRAIQ